MAKYRQYATQKWEQEQNAELYQFDNQNAIEWITPHEEQRLEDKLIHMTMTYSYK